MAFIDKSTVDYLGALIARQDTLPITHMCGECDRAYEHAAEAATDHGVIKTGGDWTIVIGCEGWHQLAHILPTYTTHGPHTLATHEAEMPNCDDPDCEFHHA